MSSTNQLYSYTYNPAGYTKPQWVEKSVQGLKSGYVLLLSGVLNCQFTICYKTTFLYLNTALVLYATHTNAGLNIFIFVMPREGWPEVTYQTFFWYDNDIDLKPDFSVVRLNYIIIKVVIVNSFIWEQNPCDSDSIQTLFIQIPSLNSNCYTHIHL